MKVFSKNEYGSLKSIILGRPEHANWPTGDLVFNRMLSMSTYPAKIEYGPISEDIISQAREDLLLMKDILEDHGVKVFRPEFMDHTKQFIHAGHTPTGMHTYSARDLLLTVGNMVIECPTPFVSRYREFDAYDVIKQEAIRDGCRWIAAPRARMEDAECLVGGKMNRLKLTERYPIFDAANVMRFDDKLLYLKSSTANQTGADWLQNVVGTEFEVIVWDKVYAYAHIDSTIASLSKDMILLNASRITTADMLPAFLKGHRKLWVHDMAERSFYKFPYASKWIGMNVLSINEETVMIDDNQNELKKQLTNEKFKVIQVPLRQSRTLGGGHHCVTCDLERE